MTSYINAWKNGLTFTGRTRRKDYWLFALFNFVISVLLAFGEASLTGTTLLVSLYSIAVLIPSVAILVRRLHDINTSGWFALLLLIPLLGAVVLLVMTILPGTTGANQYGEDPKG